MSLKPLKLSRRTWGINPVTKITYSKKTYRRAAAKREIRNLTTEN